MIKKHLDLIVIAILVLSLVMYDVTIELFVELFHLFFELFYNMFEFIELGIEHSVEHLFHTDRHGSQVVTFYILWMIAWFGFYRFWRALPRLYEFFREAGLEAWIRRKTEFQLYWLTLPLPHKVAMVATAIGVAYLASFFVM